MLGVSLLLPFSLTATTIIIGGRGWGILYCPFENCDRGEVGSDWVTSSEHVSGTGAAFGSGIFCCVLFDAFVVLISRPDITALVDWA